LGMRRLDKILLAGIGVLIVHQVAYTTSAIAGVQTSIVHGYLAIAWIGTSLAALALLTRAVTRSLRARNQGVVGGYQLFGSIAGGYLLMEQLERSIDGQTTFSLFAEPVFWLGLIAAPIVAVALRWSVRTVERLAGVFIATPPDRVEPSNTEPPLATTALIGPAFPPLLFAAPRRGPPRVLRF
jgi:hypothetical protein